MPGPQLSRPSGNFPPFPGNGSGLIPFAFSSQWPNLAGGPGDVNRLKGDKKWAQRPPLEILYENGYMNLYLLFLCGSFFATFLPFWWFLNFREWRFLCVFRLSLVVPHGVFMHLLRPLGVNITPVYAGRFECSPTHTSTLADKVTLPLKNQRNSRFKRL